jgi:oxygen-independent coproporphyrinogen-3 oxidase
MLSALHKEIDLRAKEVDWGQISSIYFGGGTPSVLSAREISELIEHIVGFWPLKPDAEITLEGNPDDLNPDYLKGLSSTRVNRLSVGVQSFDDELLRWMNRSHNAEQALSTLRWALDHDWDLTADLIYGIPGLSDEGLIRDIDRLVQMRLSHISAYALTVESNTVLAHRVLKGITKIDEEQQQRQYYLLHDSLKTAGYEAYELSNYALPGHRSGHNSAYWNGAPYLGIGPSAHSFLHNKRSWNISNNQEYMRSLETGVHHGESEDLSKRDRFNEHLMMSLRLIEGISLESIIEDFGEEYREHILRNAKGFIEQDWLVQDGDRIILSRNGRFFADRIASDLFML